MSSAGADERDHCTAVASRLRNTPYTKYLTSQHHLKGARFGLPIKRCWESCPADCKVVALEVFHAIREAGGTIVNVDLPSVEERIGPDGGWNWERGDPDQSEWTVVKVDAYNGINAYLRSLEKTPITSLEQVVEFNQRMSGTEGAAPGEVYALSISQDKLLEIVERGGERDATYKSALDHIRRQTRENGIDAALKYQEPQSKVEVQLDALLFCDRRGVGQQYAAQAGYPIVCIPIGLDAGGLPISLSIQHSAWKEDQLIK